MSDDIRVIKNDKLTDEQKKQLDGAPLLDPDTLDAAIIGTVETSDGYVVAAYDYEKLIDAFCDDGQSRDEAMEWIDFNTMGTIPNAGVRAPWIIEELSDDEADGYDAQCADANDPARSIKLFGKRYLRWI